MTVAALALLAYSLVLLLLLPRLVKAGWTARTPGPSLWLWHALVAGLVTSAAACPWCPCASSPSHLPTGSPGCWMPAVGLSSERRRRAQ